MQLSAQVSATGCTSLPVASYSSSNASIAAVSSTGVVTAIAPGAVTLSAKASGVSGVVALTVQAAGPAPVVSVQLSPDSGAVVIGNTLAVVATPRDASGNALVGRDILWTSQQPAIATVSAAGVVTALAEGVAEIRASSEGVTATARLTVLPRTAASIQLAPDSTAVAVGAAQALVATLRDAQGAVVVGRPLTWSSSAPAIATVSTDGLVTGVAVGAALISASADGVTATANVTVASASVATVVIAPDTGAVSVGAMRFLTASARDANDNVLSGKSVTWSSLTPALASVAASGAVTGLAVGTATVQANIDGVLATVAINVTPAVVATVTIAPSPTSLELGATLPLAATARRADGVEIVGRTVVWTSTAPEVATVSASGTVTAVQIGSTQIKATVDGVVGARILAVTLKAVASVSITLPSAVMAEGQSTLPSVVVRASDSTILLGRAVSFGSTATDVATVAPSGDGLVIAVYTGSTQIHATVEGVTGVAALDVVPSLEQDRFGVTYSHDIDSPLGEPYTPFATYTTNATGGNVRIARGGTGNYAVTFEKMGRSAALDSRDIALVSAYGTSGALCNPVASNNSADGRDLVVSVSCADLGGTPVNSRFTMAVVGSRSLAGQHAFLTTIAISDPTVDAQKIFSSSGAAPTSSSAGGGDYLLDFGLSALSKSTVFGLSNQGANGRDCNARNWNNLVGTATVRCVASSNGSAQSSRISAIMLEAGRAGKTWGFAYANQSSPTIDVPYEPSSAYQALSNGQVVTITRRATGAYTVRFPGVAGPAGQTVLVSAYGESPGPCKIASWNEEAANDLVADVRCWSRATGLPANSRFTVLMLQ